MCLLKESFSDLFVIHCPGRKKDLEHNLAAIGGGIVSFFGGGFPPKMPGIHCLDSRQTGATRCFTRIVTYTKVDAWCDKLAEDVDNRKYRNSQILPEFTYTFVEVD